MKQVDLVRTLLDAENAEEIMKYIILSYGKESPENMNHLLTFIPEIASAQLNEQQSRISKYSWAYETMLGSRLLENEKKAVKVKKTNRLPFPTMLFGCVAHFPTLQIEGCSAADQSFFNEFLEAVKSKEEFDYTNPEAWKWVNITNTEEWLLGFIHKYVDSTFQPPEVN